MIELEIKKFPNREFSFFCEFKVAFELQKRGWEVYQPLIDRYIDLIAVKDNNYRTIQVKSSRIENLLTLSHDGYESYGLTMQPKDLFHDIRHFYIWVFIDKDTNFNYFVLSVKDFIDIRYYKLPQISRRKYPSVLMRGEFRWGTDRLHPRHYLKGQSKDQWEVERVDFTEYKNKWQKLSEVYTIPSHNSECIKATEINKEWNDCSKKVIEKWKKNNKSAESIIKKYPDAFASCKKLLKESIDDDGGIMDAHLIRLTEKEADQIFKETAENWEVFLPLEKTDHVLLFRPVCANCGEYWNTSYKECFFCKTKYYRLKVCENCNRPYPENVKPKQKCECGGNLVKKCLICGKIERDRKAVFVPITFCWFCGTRQNSFEFKRMLIGEKR